jgi:hypothetical protein
MVRDAISQRSGPTPGLCIDNQGLAPKNLAWIEGIDASGTASVQA